MLSEIGTDSTIFPDFSAQKLEVHIIHKNYTINFFTGLMPHHIWDRMIKIKLYLWSKLMCFTLFNKNIHWNVFIIVFLLI